MEWAYAVTTVPARRETLLPNTLASLREGGFPEPRLFIDGVEDVCDYEEFGLQATIRWPPLHPYGNWVLGLVELYLRQPKADMFAMFQDDLLTYRNLRQYLEACDYPIRGYWNLYTYPHNERRGKSPHKGWHVSDQMGKGALGLIFSNDAVQCLFSMRHTSRRLQTPKGLRAIDGAVIHSLKKAGWKEFVHSPSLTQHTGVYSTVKANREWTGKRTFARTFRGEVFDAMELLK